MKIQSERGATIRDCSQRKMQLFSSHPPQRPSERKKIYRIFKRIKIGGRVSLCKLAFNAALLAAVRG